MKLIKTRPRFRCDFCNHTGVAASIQKHEPICWRNPNRHCSLCDDKGWTDEGDGFLVNKQPCYYCKQFDPSRVPPLDPLKELTAPTAIKESGE